jgi:5'-nucleotidase
MENAMIKDYLTLLFVSSATLFAQDSDNMPEFMSWNQTIGTSNIELMRTREGESNLTNLICDIMLERTDADFAFLNHDDIYSDIPNGLIKHLDLFKLCPFNRTLVLLEINGELLRMIIERKISGIRRGLAIGGGKVEYDCNRNNYNRLMFFQVGDHPFYPKKVYRVVTTDYLAEGNAGFELLTHVEESNIFATGILLREAIREFIIINSPITTYHARIDGRWIKR